MRTSPDVLLRSALKAIKRLAANMSPSRTVELGKTKFDEGIAARQGTSVNCEPLRQG